MPKEEWGTKRICPTTGKRFYDLNANPIVSPYSGEIVELETTKNRTMVADAEDAATKKMEAEENDEDIVLEDDEDVAIDDDLLDDDDDTEVSIEEIGDVASESDDE